MSENHKILRIFVASPSGLDQERRATWEVIEETNRRHSSHWGLQFRAIGWEDTVGGNRRAQDIINRDLETCDYFFGILADHWGSPPYSAQGSTTGYSSGFQEEYELAQQLFRTANMKDIFLFFKKIPDDKMRDVGPSLQQVLDFRQKVLDERKPLFIEFDAIDLFKSKIGDTLSNIGWETTLPQAGGDIAAPADRNSEVVGENTTTPPEPTRHFLSQETRDFLDDINCRSGDYGAVSNVDVARLRLISAGVHRAGNDATDIGVHDANLLFRQRCVLNLSNSEKTTLLTAGLRYMENQNVPLWYWTGGDIRKIVPIIQLRMVIGDENVSSSALRIADTFGYRPPDRPGATHGRYWITQWFADDHSYRLRNAAERYLLRWGEEEDIPPLQQLRERKSGQQGTNLDCLIVAIRLRCSQSAGFEELIGRNPEQISSELHQLLQGEFESLTFDVLETLARLKSDSIRLLSIKELVRRDALSQDLAEELSGDNSVDVRLEAIKALSRKGVQISESRAEDALVIERGKRGLLGLVSASGYSKDASKYDEYRRHLLESKSVNELLAIESESTPFDVDALLAACRMYPRKTEKLLRSGLRDGFEERFERRLEAAVSLSSPKGEELAKQVRSLKEFTCLGHTREALNVLTGQMKVRDIALVRKVMDRWEVESSKEVLAYFARFGTWEDVERILKLKAKAETQTTLLGGAQVRKDKGIGKALYASGKMRMVDLLDKIHSNEALSAVIEVSSRKVFAGLSDDILLKLMNSENDDVRKAAALKCLEVLSKTRVRKLFSRYMKGEEYRYYNVIHWLDLGASMPKSYVQKIVQRELQG